MHLIILFYAFSFSFTLLSSGSPLKERKKEGNTFLYTQNENPLSKYSNDWNDSKYLSCNTGKNALFLSEREKEVIFILNLARMNPSLFFSSIVKRYPKISGVLELANSPYYQSLLQFLQAQKSLPLIYPEINLYKSALCHALSSGKNGYVGHNRKSTECKTVKYFNGECCHYGSQEALEIVLDLLIDEDVPSLGHRKLLFYNFTKIGVSIQPHAKYRWNAVLDFGL